MIEISGKLTLMRKLAQMSRSVRFQKLQAPQRLYQEVVVYGFILTKIQFVRQVIMFVKNALKNINYRQV